MGGDVTAGEVAAEPKHAARMHVVTHLPGDGVGPEVTEVARACVDAVAGRHGFGIDWRNCNLGGQHYLQTGEVLPDAVLEELRRSDAILLGAVGTPEVPPGVLERGLLLRLRFELDLYINLRPSKLRPGVAGPQLVGTHGRHELADVDFVIVRENTEGLYAGAGGTVHRGTEFETATEESLNTWAGVRRCVRYGSPWCTRPTCSRMRVTCGPGSRARSRPRTASSSATRTWTPPACGWSTTRSGST